MVRRVRRKGVAGLHWNPQGKALVKSVRVSLALGDGGTLQGAHLKFDFPKPQSCLEEA